MTCRFAARTNTVSCRNRSLGGGEDQPGFHSPRFAGCWGNKVCYGHRTEQPGRGHRALSEPCQVSWPAARWESRTLEVLPVAPLQTTAPSMASAYSPRALVSVFPCLTCCSTVLAPSQRAKHSSHEACFPSANKASHALFGFHLVKWARTHTRPSTAAQ